MAKFIIIGLNSEGQKFRPSDWAERMCGNLSTFRNRRVYFSPLLRPAVIDGIKCVVIDDIIKQKHPKIYQDVMQFVQANRLKVDSFEAQ